MPNRHYAGLSTAVALLVLGGAQASACDWWSCRDGAYGPRKQTRVYGYAYRARPSVPFGAPPPSGWGAFGMTAPILTYDGIQMSGVPGPGPTLFGPPATKPAASYGNVRVRGWQRRAVRR
jgi:hypothetical protein